MSIISTFLHFPSPLLLVYWCLLWRATFTMLWIRHESIMDCSVVQIGSQTCKYGKATLLWSNPGLSHAWAFGAPTNASMNQNLYHFQSIFSGHYCLTFMSNPTVFIWMFLQLFVVYSCLRWSAALHVLFFIFILSQSSLLHLPLEGKNSLALNLNAGARPSLYTDSYTTLSIILNQLAQTPQWSYNVFNCCTIPSTGNILNVSWIIFIHIFQT